MRNVATRRSTTAAQLRAAQATDATRAATLAIRSPNTTFVDSLSQQVQ